MEINNSTYYLPSEWQKQIAVQLTWPHAKTDWAPYLEDIVRMEVRMADEITKREDLIIATPEKDAVRGLLKAQLTEQQFNRVKIVEMPTDDTWARDHGAITLLPRPENKAKTRKAILLDFCFNGWGKKFPAENDNRITQNLNSSGVFEAYYNYEMKDHLDFVLEGGSIESDGKGTFFTTSQCLLAPNRNQPLSKEGIEDYLKKVLCAERIVWLDYGNLIGDDTDGHIDTIVRIAPDDTILYVKCDDNKDEQFEDFDALEAQLKSLRTKEGKPYRLLPLPMPKAMYDDGDRLPATYANFLIINGAVLVPTYNQPELDKKALEIIQQAFPDREIIGIDAQVAVRQHGSLHCLTMQFPTE
jgi:agmatine/peptidylarginine deiminase